MNDYFKKACEYAKKQFVNEDRFLQGIRQKTACKDFPIQIEPEEGQLLQLLINLANVKNIIEIGTLAGYSTIWMARALPQNGKIITIEKSKERFNLAYKNFNALSAIEPANGKKIEILNQSAQDALPNLSKQGPFDMIFIDADKISYLQYLQWSENNIKKGGLIVADNTFLFGAVFGQSYSQRISATTLDNMKQFNNALADKQKYLTFTIPTKEGFTIAYKLF